jgi:hypothetical protein
MLDYRGIIKHWNEGNLIFLLLYDWPAILGSFLLLKDEIFVSSFTSRITVKTTVKLENCIFLVLKWIMLDYLGIILSIKNEGNLIVFF